MYKLEVWFGKDVIAEEAVATFWPLIYKICFVVSVPYSTLTQAWYHTPTTGEKLLYVILAELST